MKVRDAATGGAAKANLKFRIMALPPEYVTSQSAGAQM